MSILRSCSAALGFLFVFTASAGTAAAVDVVPELSPGAIGSALTLLAAGTMLVRASRRSK
jgi:hypothetical protein